MWRLGVPVFSERWSGPQAPLTKAMLRRGFDVLPPFDVERAREMDYFSDAGKEVWKGLGEEDPDYEHHAPECKTFSRARGRPFYIDGYRYDGPPALRDEKNVMGFPGLRGDEAVKVRQGTRWPWPRSKDAKNCTKKESSLALNTRTGASYGTFGR